MSETKVYLFHKLSSIFPLMEGEDFDALVEDMRIHGQQNEGKLFEGEILDGRNRYRACAILKIPFECKDLPEGMDPLDYIISENLHRRHLTIAQLAAIGLLLLKMEEEKAKKRISKLAKLQPKDEDGKFVEKPIGKNLYQLDEEEFGEPGRSAVKVAKKVRISHATLSKAKKIEEIAEKDKFIAEKWEDAKKGETSIDAVYQKAQIIEDIGDLTKPQQDKIKEKMDKEERTTKQIKEEVQDLKDNLKRAEIAERSRAMAKKKKEMEKLHFKIQESNKKLHELQNALKLSEANLVVLSKETVKKYPHLKSDEPAYVLTQLDLYYDTLDMEIYDEKLKKLRGEYDVLEKPLRDKLAVLEGEYKTKKDVIVKEKIEKNKEVTWVENQEELMAGEFDKQEVWKESIEKTKKEVKELQVKYDGG